MDRQVNWILAALNDLEAAVIRPTLPPDLFQFFLTEDADLFPPERDTFCP